MNNEKIKMNGLTIGRLNIQILRLDGVNFGVWVLRGVPYVDTAVMIGIDMAVIGARFEVRK